MCGRYVSKIDADVERLGAKCFTQDKGRLSMETELLKTVGQIAGIGGIALGVFLLLYRDIIRKKIFPTLTKQQGFQLLMLISVLVWSIALAGIAIAKAKGKYKGKKSKFTEEDIRQIKGSFKKAQNKAELAKKWGISRGYLYELVKDSQ